MNNPKRFLTAMACGLAWVLMCAMGFMFVVKLKEGDHSGADRYLVLMFLQMYAVMGFTRAVRRKPKHRPIRKTGGTQ